MMTHQLRDGTYQCDKDGLDDKQYTAWQRENARTIAKGPGPFYPALKQRPDGFLTVEFVVDDGFWHFESDGKHSVHHSDGSSDVYSPRKSQEACGDVFNSLCAGLVIGRVRNIMASIIGNDFENDNGMAVRHNYMFSARRAFEHGVKNLNHFTNVHLRDTRTGEEIIAAFVKAKAALAAATTTEEQHAARRILYVFWTDEQLAELAERVKAEGERRRSEMRAIYSISR